MSPPAGLEIFLEPLFAVPTGKMNILTLLCSLHVERKAVIWPLLMQQQNAPSPTTSTKATPMPPVLTQHILRSQAHTGLTPGRAAQTH